jgi:hypothetical protein
MGVSMDDDGLRLSGNWTADTSNAGYTTYTNSDNGVVVAVDNSQTDIDMAVNDIVIKSSAT